MARLLQITDLAVNFGRGEDMVKAVDGVTLEVDRGEVIGLVGESGSGKSVTALSVMRLLPYPVAWHPKGTISFDGRDLGLADDDQMRAIRGNRISMIFQEPLTFWMRCSGTQ